MYTILLERTVMMDDGSVRNVGDVLLTTYDEANQIWTIQVWFGTRHIWNFQNTATTNFY